MNMYSSNVTIVNTVIRSVSSNIKRDERLVLFSGELLQCFRKFWNIRASRFFNEYPELYLSRTIVRGHAALNVKAIFHARNVRLLLWPAGSPYVTHHICLGLHSVGDLLLQFVGHSVRLNFNNK